VGLTLMACLKRKPTIFMKCPGCRQWFGMRALDQVLANAHDAEIEIGEGQEPPRREGPVHLGLKAKGK
jgi:hypothetical protein